MAALTLIEIITLYVAIKNYRRHPRLRIFVAYTLFSMLQIWTPYFCGLDVNKVISNKIFGAVTNTFMIFEFTVCIFFILQHLTSRARRRAVIIDAVIYVLFLLWAMVRHPESVFAPVFFFFESFFLLVPCLLYIYDLFVNPPPGKLRDYPSFWVVTGFLVLNGCSVPLLLAVELLRRFAQNMYSINFILYMGLFLLLMRAYRCAPLKRADDASA